MELRTTSRDSQGKNTYLGTKTMTKSMERAVFKGTGLVYGSAETWLTAVLGSRLTAGLPLEPRQLEPASDWPLTLGALGESIRFHPCPPAKSPSPMLHHLSTTTKLFKAPNIDATLDVNSRHQLFPTRSPTSSRYSNNTSHFHFHRHHQINNLLPTSTRARARPRTLP